VKLKLTKEFEEKIKKLEDGKSALQYELRKSGDVPKIDVDLLLRESTLANDQGKYEQSIQFSNRIYL
jgi:hypothetical protein